MNNIKKLLAFSIVIGLIVSIYACGGDKAEEVQPNIDKPTIAQQYSLSKTIQEENGKAVVTNVETMAVVVNKQRSLPDGYVPPDLVEPNVKFSFAEKVEKRLMRKEAAQALEELFDAAKQDNMDLFAVSGYRSYTRQKTLFNLYVRKKGEAYAESVSAVPGTSEHQTGLAMDVSSPSAKYKLVQSFGETDEGKWLVEHAAEHGFIIRYPQGKEEITGYAYEPWHIRYVGKEIAQEVAKQGITLEQYFDDSAQEPVKS